MTTVIYISSVPTICEGVGAPSAFPNEITLTVGSDWCMYRLFVTDY